MKVRVEGENGTASILRGYLSSNDYYLLPGLLSGLVPEPADFTFYISERAAVKWPVLEGIDAPFFLAATKRLGELTPGGAVVLIYRGHEYGDRAIGVTVPAEDGERTAAARAMLRALNDMRKAGLPRAVPKVRWWKRALWAVGLALLPTAASAQPVYWPVKFVTSSGSVIWAGDAANNAVRVNVVASTGGGGGLTDAELRATPVPVSGSGNFAVTGTFWQATQPVSGTFWQATQPVSGTFWQATQPVSGPLTDAQLRATPVPISGTVTANAGTGTLNVSCVSGCTAGGSFADAAAFTFGTTPVGLTAFVVDDTATNTVAENSAGAARMSTNRIPYFDLSKSGANATAFLVTGTGGTFPVTGTFFQATQPVSIAATVTVSDGAGAMNVIVDSGAVTNTPPANQTVNLNQVVGTTVDVNSGTKSAGTIRVVLATDQPALTNKLLVTPDSVALPANQSVNLAQVAGVATATGNGTAAGAVRVALPTDGTGVVGLIAGSATVGSIASVTTSIVPGTAATNLGKAEDVAHTTGDTGVAVWGVRTDPTTTAYTTATTEYSPVAVDYVGALTTGVHPARWSCFVQAVTVTTQCEAASAAGLRNYVTDIHCSNLVATVQTLDIVYGTGAACVTGITALTHKFQLGTNGLTTSPFLLSAPFGVATPLVPAAAAAICIRPSAATSFGCTVTGYAAP